ncbi:hypothetical protein ACFV4F_17605 [Kitasatospora sp. NPDC059722]|uniref:hypothetical protein n=1 Tax=Kitasatospora sp. NPDC059722 TaxID=3346925 RepID=UPI00367AB29C
MAYQTKKTATRPDTTIARDDVTTAVTAAPRPVPVRRAFPTSGHGLPGLAERVRLLHGEMESGPAGPQQWRLAVRLPVRSSS